MGFLSRQFFSPVAVGLGMPAKPLVATSSSVRSSGQLQFPSRQAAFPHPFFFFLRLHFLILQVPPTLAQLTGMDNAGEECTVSVR